MAHAELDLLLSPETPVKVIGRRHGLTAEERLGLAIQAERFAWARANTPKRRGGQERRCPTRSGEVESQGAPRVLTSERPHTERNAR
jgi:hypothetical protein